MRQLPANGAGDQVGSHFPAVPQEPSGRQSGKPAKLMNEVCLIGVSATQGHIGPGPIANAGQGIKYLAESDDAGKTFGGQTHGSLEFPLQCTRRGRQPPRDRRDIHLTLGGEDEPSSLDDT